MISWANIIIMVLNAILSLYFYNKSASPAALEKKIGEKAYKKCGRYRLISAVFMGLFTLQYGVYYFFPLSLPIPNKFPWPWWISAIIAVTIAVPSGMLLKQGARYAGLESKAPQKKQRLFRGIYRRIRHPQTVGELPFFWVISFLSNSPFLALFSFIRMPVFYFMCRAEEKDPEIRYGSRYLNYKQKTGMFFPKTRRS
jgi:protein-S-isoprenylcysteine O-methyltransferase Ste14